MSENAAQVITIELTTGRLHRNKAIVTLIVNEPVFINKGGLVLCKHSISSSLIFDYVK
jgi:hypothetical protein